MKISSIILPLVFMGSLATANAQKYVETLEMNNGTKIKGTILSQVFGDHLVFRRANGDTTTYKLDKIKSITKKRVRVSREDSIYSNYNLVQPLNLKGKDLNTAINFKESAAKLFRRGYKSDISIALAYGIGETTENRMEISTIHGYQFNPYIFLGAGVNVNVHLKRDKVAVPVTANLRLNLAQREIIPYLQLKVGYSAVGLEGTYINPTLGFTFCGSSAFGFSVLVGYSQQNIKKDPLSETRASSTANAFTFGIGLDF